MNLEIAREIEIKEEKYIVLSIILENNTQYAFANKLDTTEEPTEEYRIVSKVQEDYEIVTDEIIINKLLPLFQQKIKNDLNEILN